ncbi:MAG: PAS domain S-box protein [Coxiellaceae bacterium]|nr:PAS domain S-box protein [Coxiellaceae bacterium]
MNDEANITWQKNWLMLLGLAALLMGLVVIFGWYTNNTSLIQIMPYFAPMQYNTALGFVLGGIGALTYIKYRNASLICGLLISFIGILTLYQYLFAANLGLDEFFMKSYVMTKTSHPGRMAPNTAACFSLVGVIYILQYFCKSHHKIHLYNLILASFIIALSFIALFGYLTGIQAAYGWGALTRMAVHTSVGFILLGLAVFPYNYAMYKKRLNAKSWLLFSIILIAGLFLLTLFLQAAKTYEDKGIHAISTNKANEIKNRILVNVADISNSLERLFSRIHENSYQHAKDLQNDAKYYLKHNPALTELHLVLPNTNEPIIVHNSRINDMKAKANISTCMTLLKNSRDAQVANLRINGNMELLCIADEDINNIAILNMKTVLRNVLHQEMDNQFNIVISLDNEAILTLPTFINYAKTQHTNAVSSITFYKTAWEINVWPTNKFINEVTGPYTLFLLIFGLGITILLAFMTRNWQISKVQNATLIKANTDKDASELLKNKILESAPQAIIISNSEGKIIYCNAHAIILWGYSENELLNTTIETLIPDRYRASHPEHRRNYFSIFNAKQMGKGRYLALLTKTGSELPVQISLTPIVIENNKCVICNIVNKLDQKNYEDRIKKQNMNLQLIYDVTNISSNANNITESLQYSIDIICHKLNWNIGHIYALDNQDKALHSTDIWLLPSSGEFEKFKQASNKLIFQKGQGLPGRVLLSRTTQWVNNINDDDTILRKDICQELSLFSAVCIPIIINDSVVYVLELFSTQQQPPTDEYISLFNILGEQLSRASERQIAHDMLQAAENDKHLLLEHAAEGIFGINLNGNITFANSASQILLGYTDTEIKGLSITKILTSATDDAANSTIQSELMSTIKQHRIYTIPNAVFYSCDKSAIHVDFKASPIISNGSLKGAVIIFSDISLRIESERKSATYLKQLEKSYADLDDFTYMASHDLKEPLRGICTYSNLLLENNADILDADSKNKLSTLQTLSKRIEALIDIMLTFTQVSREKLHLEFHSINDLLRDTISMITKENIKIEVSDSMPTIMCDPEALNNVFKSIIENGLIYNDNDEKCITVDYKEDKTHHIFLIRDNGVSIPPEHFTTAFKLFKRLSKASEYSKGLGVGLTLSQQIVHKHEGEIWIESSDANGTTVCFSVSKEFSNTDL